MVSDYSDGLRRIVEAVERSQGRGIEYIGDYLVLEGNAYTGRARLFGTDRGYVADSPEELLRLAEACIMVAKHIRNGRSPS